MGELSEPYQAPNEKCMSALITYKYALGRECRAALCSVCTRAVHGLLLQGCQGGTTFPVVPGLCLDGALGTRRVVGALSDCLSMPGGPSLDGRLTICLWSHMAGQSLHVALLSCSICPPEGADEP